MNSIGRVVSVSYDKLIFEVSDFEKLIYNYNGDIYITRGVIDYVTIKNQFGETFIYQVTRVEDKEIQLVKDEKSKFDYTGRFECVPIGILENGIINFNLKKYPFLQDKVYLSSDEELKNLFSTSNRNESISLGLIQEKYEAQVDVNSLLTHHSAVLGNTGSGKSTTVRRILNEISSKKTSNLSVSIFDVHNEYSQLDGVQNIDVLNEYKINLNSLELQDWINLIKPSELVQLPIVQTALKVSNALSSNKLNEEKFRCYIAYNLYFNQQTDAVAKRTKIVGLLEKTSVDTQRYSSVFGNLKEQDEAQFVSSLKRHMYTKYAEISSILECSEYCVDSFDDIFKGLEYVFLLEECRGNTQARGYSATLDTRIKNIQNRYGNIFERKNVQSHEQNIQKKGMTVYNVSSMDDDLMLFFTTYILKKQFHESCSIGLEERDVKLFIFEEAHRYISKIEENSLFSEVEIFKKIAREGRKFGCFLMLSSQRPSELSSTVLSQCNNYLIHRIKNNVDLEYLLKTIPYINKNQLTRFSFLPTGTAYLVGELYPIPVEVEVTHDKDSDVTVTPKVKFN